MELILVSFYGFVQVYLPSLGLCIFSFISLTKIFVSVVVEPTVVVPDGLDFFLNALNVVLMDGHRFVVTPSTSVGELL